MCSCELNRQIHGFYCFMRWEFLKKNKLTRLGLGLDWVLRVRGGGGWGGSKWEDVSKFHLITGVGVSCLAPVLLWLTQVTGSYSLELSWLPASISHSLGPETDGAGGSCSSPGSESVRLVRSGGFLPWKDVFSRRSLGEGWLCCLWWLRWPGLTCQHGRTPPSSSEESEAGRWRCTISIVITTTVTE